MTEDENARAPSEDLSDTAEIITDADEVTEEVIPEEISEELPAIEDSPGEPDEDAAPAADESETDAVQAVEEPEEDAAPAADEPDDDAAPAVEEPADDFEPVADEPDDDTAPAVEEPVDDIAPTVDEPDDSAAPAADEPFVKETPPYPASVPPPEQPKKKKKKNIVLIAVILAIIAAAIIGGVLYMRYFIPREIHVSETTLDLWVGDTAKLTYTIVPSSADNLEVAWVSSNEEIAAIDEFGVVTAVSGGKCAIAVATGNGKTDVCIVSVTDPAQVQKQSLNEVKAYVETLDTTTEDGHEVHTVEEIDDTHSFQISSDEDNLLLIYKSTGQMEEFGVDAVYTTSVKLSPENIDTAEVIQNDTLYVYGFPISMIGTGTMNLASYQHGDQVPLTTTSSTVEGLDASDALHELTDGGSMICIDKFEEFLSNEGFDFSLAQFGFKNFGSLEAAPEPEGEEENALTASEAQESWDEIQEEDVLSSAEASVEEDASGNAEDSAAVSVGAVAVENRALPEEATVEQSPQEEPAITSFPSCRPGFSFETTAE